MKRSAANPSSDPLDRYFADVRKNPMLAAEDERALARAARDGGAPEAVDRLVRANLRFVVKVAYRYRRPGVRVADLVQEGNVGLLRAARRFDPERGVRFVSYAAWWIRAAIQDYLERAHTGRHGAPDVSLDAPLTDDGDGSRLDEVAADDPPQDCVLADLRQRALAEARIREALATLGHRERLIAEERFMSDEPVTLTDLARRLGVSRERTRQLEARAKQRLRRQLEDFIREIDWRCDGADRAPGAAA
jgi:RNA polymerase sigma factor (sigma-70 family)